MIQITGESNYNRGKQTAAGCHVDLTLKLGLSF